jgi:hypothetical protein
VKTFGGVLGVLVGFLLAFPFMLVHVNMEYGIHTLFPSLPRDPSALEMLLSSILLYVVWFGVLMLIVKRDSRLSATNLFLFMLPLPPIVIEQILFHSSLMSGGVH